MLNQIIIINYFSRENYDQQVPLGPIPFFFPPDQPSGNKNRMAPGNLLYDHQAVAILRYVLLVFLSYTRSWDLIQDWEKGDPNDRSRLGWGRGIDNSLNLLPSFLFDPFFLPCDKTAPTEWLNTLIVVKIMRGWTESPEEVIWYRGETFTRFPLWMSGGRIPPVVWGGRPTLTASLLPWKEEFE